MVVLEFVRPPEGPVGALYRVYLKTVLPAIGGAISGEARAYRYLSDSVESYRTPLQLQDLAHRAGWTAVDFTALNFGTVGVLAGSPGVS
jgi:ubiquinone/menaquinone biosynthesis C-methylase UbiE